MHMQYWYLTQTRPPNHETMVRPWSWSYRGRGLVELSYWIGLSDVWLKILKITWKIREEWVFILDFTMTFRNCIVISLNHSKGYSSGLLTSMMSILGLLLTVFLLGLRVTEGPANSHSSIRSSAEMRGVFSLFSSSIGMASIDWNNRFNTVRPT